MNKSTSLGPWVRRFLMEHLVSERNLAHNTQLSYRDALAQLLQFTSKALKRPIDRMKVDDVSSDSVRRFLEQLERDRGVSITTRNQRLAAIRAMARFIGMRGPEHLQWCSEICSIPFKKGLVSELGYLDKPEMDAMLEAPDRRTKQGERDHGLLLFLYNTGARADEAAKLNLGDLILGSSPSARIVGKGAKIRHCPLWASTAEVLCKLTVGRGQDERVFLNRRGQPITRFGIYALVTRYAVKASLRAPSLDCKRVSPHTIRHTTAVHLLRAGVDINTIRAWLGHVSLDTTHIYAEVDLEMKAKALAHCEIPGDSLAKKWRSEPKLMNFLKSL